ncbi:lipopolysaccharide biosynthesis protein [Paraglaciecola sp. L3A3]|uniref:lipopolysaccharide biosynthesis protein n=1 Tax=Paraglaciecola sp. L3A3 TaxID=2686358 RepID=UPI00131BC260|nr:lipopolysaccharide biosynthesis protein [Paraglaciecola sp. L3A3]
MTEQSQQVLENKIKKLRCSLTTEQWSDADFLLIRVKELEKTDLAFAFRLMQRVRNLSPTKSNCELLDDLRAKTFKLHPELAITSSHNMPSRRHTFSGLKRLGKALFSSSKQTGMKKLNQPIVMFVIIPFFLFGFYQTMLASPRYESQAQLIVKEPNGMATLDPAMAVMSGFGISGGSSDTQLVKSYIHSADMLKYLDREINVIEHFSDNQYDSFSRLSEDASKENQLKFFLKMISIEIDENSQVITVKAQAFEPQVAHKLSELLVERAEWYINEIGRNLAKNQLDFVQKEHTLVQEKLSSAKSVLLRFQRRYNLLDPEAEGMALQQISYQLEGKISAKKTELRALATSMSGEAPLVLQAQAELDSLVQQLNNERSRLTDNDRGPDTNDTEAHSMAVGEILAKYGDYKIDLELALQAYTSSLVSLEKSRIEAYRQLKYLVVVESPTLPEDASYPKIFYNLALFLALVLMLFGIVKIIIATVNELR